MNIRDRQYYDYREFPLFKPETDVNDISDFVVVFTKQDEMDIAIYNANKNLWYSLANPKGFNNVEYWCRFDVPEKFGFDKALSKLMNGENICG